MNGDNEVIDIIIVGAGTAGLSAAIYGVRAGKSVLVFEASNYGGQIINTPEIENYPGLKKTSGFEFSTELYEQAVDLGADVKFEKVLKIEEVDGLKSVVTNKNEYISRTVILATGAKNRTLGLEHEKEWIGKGISYCATCDGMFFRGKDVAVVGGGNTALEDALVLSDYCNKVYIIHRRDKFKGDHKEQETLKNRDNVEAIMNSNVIKLNGDDHVEGITVENDITKETREIPVSGVFVAIGQMPDNIEFSNLVKLDRSGYIEAGEDCRTNYAGIFAAGDCRTKSVRQLATATADGAVAAIAACDYINNMES